MTDTSSSDRPEASNTGATGAEVEVPTAEDLRCWRCGLALPSQSKGIFWHDWLGLIGVPAVVFALSLIFAFVVLYGALFTIALLVLAAVVLAIRFIKYPRRCPRCRLRLSGRSIRWQAAGCCVHCGYNLTGNTSGTCPECGAKTDFVGD